MLRQTNKMSDSKSFQVIHMFRLLVDMAEMVQEKMSHPMVLPFLFSAVQKCDRRAGNLRLCQCP